MVIDFLYGFLWGNYGGKSVKVRREGGPQNGLLGTVLWNFDFLTSVWNEVQERGIWGFLLLSFIFREMGELGIGVQQEQR